MTQKNVTKVEKLFGTDGIRGMANEYPMTGEVSMAVGRAVAHVLKSSNCRRQGHASFRLHD
jgi:phosphoglucosamine mutase